MHTPLHTPFLEYVVKIHTLHSAEAYELARVLLDLIKENWIHLGSTKETIIGSKIEPIIVFFESALITPNKLLITSLHNNVFGYF